MAWIQVSEQGHLATSETAAGERTATRVFIAVSDEPTTTVAAETAIAGGNSIPVRGAGHPDDSGRKVKTVSAKPDPESARKVFTVEVGYSSKADTAEQIENPLARPLKVAWDFDDDKETYFLDRSDPPKPVVNAAGERFEELLERDTGSLTATVTRNIAPDAYDPAEAILYKDAVNDDAFQLEGKHIDVDQCKMKSYTAGEVQNENNVEYRVAKWVLQFRPSWKHVVENRGFNERDPDDGSKLREIVKGTPPVKVDRPWPLNAAGRKMPNPSDIPTTITFVPYNPRSFGQFGFA